MTHAPIGQENDNAAIVRSTGDEPVGFDSRGRALDREGDGIAMRSTTWPGISRVTSAGPVSGRAGRSGSMAAALEAAA